jgi:hypothetical protein
MSLFWGEDLIDQSAGLDILGVRGIDQAVEAALVNGITTISQRGRYFTLLPWVLGEFFANELSSGEAEFNEQRLLRFLRCVEFLTLAATKFDPNVGEAGGAALGADLNLSLIQALQAGEVVDFPVDTGGAMLGTYYGPCRALGLLADGGGGAPFHLTSRGKRVWEARRHSLVGSQTNKAIIDATPLTKKLVEEAIPQFSLAEIAASGAEASLLREALLTAWEPEGSSGGKEQVASAYARFGETINWIRRLLANGPARPDDILASNMKKCCEGVDNDPIAIRWAEYEWRRRCHFSLELILAAVCGHLAAVGDSTVALTIRAWRDATEGHLPIEWLWPKAGDAWAMNAADAMATVPANTFLGVPLRTNELRNQRSAQQALPGLALLVELEKESLLLRKNGLFSHRNGPGDNAIEAISNARDDPFPALMQRLVEVCVVIPHLTTTLRKMSAGQKCSLRFFPDGPVLRPTGIGVQPGHSGDRLSNTMRVLADAGVLSAQSRGRYAILETSL